MSPEAKEATGYVYIGMMIIIMIITMVVHLIEKARTKGPDDEEKKP